VTPWISAQSAQRSLSERLLARSALPRDMARTWTANTHTRPLGHIPFSAASYLNPRLAEPNLRHYRPHRPPPSPTTAFTDHRPHRPPPSPTTAFTDHRLHRPPPSPTTAFTDHRLHRPPPSPTTAFTDHRLHRPPPSPTTAFTDHRLHRPPPSPTTAFTDHRLHRPPPSPTTAFTDHRLHRPPPSPTTHRSAFRDQNLVWGIAPGRSRNRAIAWSCQCVFYRGGHRDRPRRRDARGDLDPAGEPWRRLSLPDELGRGR